MIMISITNSAIQNKTNHKNAYVPVKYFITNGLSGKIYLRKNIENSKTSVIVTIIISEHDKTLFSDSFLLFLKNIGLGFAPFFCEANHKYPRPKILRLFVHISG